MSTATRRPSLPARLLDRLFPVRWGPLTSEPPTFADDCARWAANAILEDHRATTVQPSPGVERLFRLMDGGGKVTRDAWTPQQFRISTAIRPFLAAAVIERHGLDIRQNLDSAQVNPSLGGRGNPGGDPVRSGGVAGSIPASAAPPSGSRNGRTDP